MYVFLQKNKFNLKFFWFNFHASNKAADAQYPSVKSLRCFVFLLMKHISL